MTVKEKAKELVDRFYMGDDFPVECGTYCQGGTPSYIGIAKQCALICVDEMESFYKDIMRIGTSKQMLYYFNEIRKEIQKL